jgi:hypothetical protein
MEQVRFGSAGRLNARVDQDARSAPRGFRDHRQTAIWTAALQISAETTLRTA